MIFYLYSHVKDHNSGVVIQRKSYFFNVIKYQEWDSSTSDKQIHLIFSENYRIYFLKHTYIFFWYRPKKSKCFSFFIDCVVPGWYTVCPSSSGDDYHRAHWWSAGRPPAQQEHPDNHHCKENHELWRWAQMSTAPPVSDWCCCPFFVVVFPFCFILGLQISSQRRCLFL